MGKILFKVGLFVLCPDCDSDALEVVIDVVAGSRIRPENFKPLGRTTIARGTPIVSGCCGAPLLGIAAGGKRDFLAMRTREATTK